MNRHAELIDEVLASLQQPRCYLPRRPIPPCAKHHHCNYDGCGNCRIRRKAWNAYEYSREAYQGFVEYAKQVRAAMRELEAYESAHNIDRDPPKTDYADPLRRRRREQDWSRMLQTMKARAAKHG